ncbi:EAP30/Vps36 family-domain-containing protein [Phlyctochytrium arcticum]|nr:EAP30/Vps36 family-domain-containing protein [Phlyctochytrium arcticum]
MPNIMKYVQDLELTAAGRPLLAPDETVSITQKDVGLYENKERLKDFDAGVAFVTTHRLLWVDESRGKGIQLSLGQVKDCTTKGGIWKASSPKITIIIRDATKASSRTLKDLPPIPSCSAPPVIGSKKSEPWTCEICQNVNHGGPKCDLCGVVQKPKVDSLPEKGSAYGGVGGGSVNTQPGPLPPKTNQKPCPACTFLNHSALSNCEICGSTLPDGNPSGSPLGSTDSSLVSATTSQFRDDFSADQDSGDAESCIKLSFRGGGMMEFHKALKASLDARAWENVSSNQISVRPTIAQPRDQGPSLGGVAGIMRSVEQSNQVLGDSVNEAFGDLQALMDKAADMVKLAESISVQLAQSSAGEKSDSSDMMTFRSYLVELGISSPVTKQTAGDMYSHELARQLAEFLERALKRHGGMLPLTDIYCLFNRARGTALISPNDLLKCCNLFEALNLPYRLRQFPSGLLIVQSVDHSDEVVTKRVHDYIKQLGSAGAQAMDWAQAGNISVVLATEQLLMAESEALICRDDTIEGMRYFDNIIANFQIITT